MRGDVGYVEEVIDRVIYEAGQEGGKLRLGPTTAWLSRILLNRDDLWCLVFRNGSGSRSYLIADLGQIQTLLDDVNR